MTGAGSATGGKGTDDVTLNVFDNSGGVSGESTLERLKAEGVTRLTTETGAGQWGTSLSFATAQYGIDCEVWQVRASYDQKPYRRAVMETYGARCVASPSNETNYGRSVLAGQRIGILGANGQGKSTLVKTIARTMPALAGTLTEGKGLNIGYFAQQELDVLHPQDNPLEHMIRLAKELGPQSGESSREQDLRNYLGTFNFSGDMVKQAVGTMSGGEKARLVLAMIVWQRPNLLLLDEPTNHLDLATREALSMALNEFEGTVMLVSHDRALLRAVCDEFWMVGRGKVEPFDGDLDDYQRYLLDESKRLREEAKLAEQAAAVPTSSASEIGRALPSKACPRFLSKVFE